MKVPKEVDNLIMNCLAPRVEDRLQSASEISQRIIQAERKRRKGSELDDIFARIKAREQRKSDLCWNCRRPLPY